MNSVVLMGRLTRDPELKQTPGGILTCSFSLAVERDYKSANGEAETDFINCVAWRKTAEFIANYFNKGKMIAVEGSIQTRSWKDNDGNNRYATDVVVNKAHFCAKENNSNLTCGTKQGIQAMPSDMEYTSDDDLPF